MPAAAAAAPSHLPGSRREARQKAAESMLLSTAQALEGSSSSTAALHVKVWNQVAEWGARARDSSVACAASMGARALVQAVSRAPGSGTLSHDRQQQGGAPLSAPAQLTLLLGSGAVSPVYAGVLLALAYACGAAAHALWRWMYPLPPQTVWGAAWVAAAAFFTEAARHYAGVTWTVSGSGDVSIHVTANGAAVILRCVIFFALVVPVGYRVLAAVWGWCATSRQHRGGAKSNDPRLAASAAPGSTRWGLFGRPLAATPSPMHIKASPLPPPPTPSLSLMAAS